MFFIPSACQTPQFKSNHVLAPNIVAPVTVQAGHFLSARQATYLNDVSAAADFYLAALQPGEQNVRLLQQGFVTQYRNGNIDTAAA